MSLDNFGVKSTRKKSLPKKKKTTSASNKSKKKTANSKQSSPEMTGERKKFYLKCTTKCGYKRTLKKRSLSEDDYLCRKCRKKMQIYKEE